MDTSTSFSYDLEVQSCVEVLFPVFATIGVIIRLVLRQRYKIALLWDDALIVLAVLFSWGLWGVWYWMTIHILKNRETALRPTTPPQLEKLCMAMDILYGEGVNVVKFAILMFYLRAFGSDPNAHKARFVIWGLIGVVALYTVARAIETVYLCPPICFGLPREYSVAGWQFAMRVINWLQELAILLFPIPILWKLKISTKRKLAIYACFFLGIVTCVAGAGRVSSAVKLYLVQNARAKTEAVDGGLDQKDWFYNYYIPQMSQMTIWSMAELNLGIVTATLPAIRSPAISVAKSAVRKFRASVAYSGQDQQSPNESMASRTRVLDGSGVHSEKTISTLSEDEIP